MIVELFDSYGYDSKGGNFICGAVKKGLKYEPETRVSRKRNALCTFLIESGQETNDINQSPLLYKNNVKNESGGHDYSHDYLTTVALEDGTISFTIFSWADTTYLTSVSYSVNGGDWITFNNSDGREEDEVISINVSNGDKIRWKGIANHIGDDGDNACVITSDCEFDAEGNIMSLLYGDEFDSKTSLEGHNYAFSYLFDDMYNGNECLIVNTENLILPATTLAEDCYLGMFMNCTSLITAPELPATTLTTNCYIDMFKGCTSLTSAPELPATTLTDYCYVGMFEKCTSLTMAPELHATTLAQSCYLGMFNGCTSLTSAPELPATTLATHCYGNMFNGCTALTSAPELPATTLTDYCYVGMFMGCTSLTSTPEILPATTLAQSCYHNMFNGCTALTSAPELPATTLASNCYIDMFKGCTNLNYIKCLATNISASYCTTSWVSGVATTGTFVKASSMSSWTSGNDGIPSGWTVLENTTHHGGSND